MRIDLRDPRVDEAIALVKARHNPKTAKELEEVFENTYHCRIVPDPNDIFCNHGHLDISEEKYQNWFVLQFGGGKDE